MEQTRDMKRVSVFLVVLLHFSWFVYESEAHNKASAVLVFGDSTVDPGNNNYIATAFKANFPPYGRSFPGKKATGRFTDGRMVTDFLASYVGVKDFIPAYLQPGLSTDEILTGVSFASAGTGYDPVTSHIGNVLPVRKQVEYLKAYKKRIAAKIGQQQMENHIKNAVFFVSAGTNDFVINYFNLPLRSQTYNISSYQQLVLQHQKSFLQSLWAEGARNILVVGLPPMGCLPVMLTLHNLLKPRHCIEKYSVVGSDYNKLLQTELASMQTTLASSGVRMAYVDTFAIASDFVKNASKYGFEETSEGCCGTGLFEASYLCSPLSHQCPDPSKFLFFDSIHPSEYAYGLLFKIVVRPIIDRILGA